MYCIMHIHDFHFHNFKIIIMSVIQSMAKVRGYISAVILLQLFQDTSGEVELNGLEYETVAAIVQSFYTGSSAFAIQSVT